MMLGKTTIGLDMKIVAYKTLGLVIAAAALAGCGSADEGAEATPKLSGQLATDSAESAARSGAMVGTGVAVGQQTRSSSSELEQNSGTVGPRSFEFSSACDNASGTMKISVSDDAMSMGMTFSQCMGEDQSYVDGFLGFQFKDINDTGSYVDMIMDYQAFTVTSSGGDSFYLNGDMRAIVDETAGTMKQSTARFETKQTIDGTTESSVLERYTFNGQMEDSELTQWNYDFYITGDDDGTFHIWSDGNIQLDTNNQGRTGKLYIEGENAKLTVTLSNSGQTPMAALALDTDKDGEVDLTGEMTQAEFYQTESNPTELL